MKTAIYVGDGILEFVLTPETEIDRKVIDELETAKSLKTFRGQFYDCNGGWRRWKDTYDSFNSYGSGKNRDDSLIFRVENPVEAQK